MRQLLSYRDVRLLLAGQTLSAFGDWALLIVLAVWMKALTGSSARAGLVLFVFVAGSLAAPLGGLLADRVRRRPLMMATDAVLGVSVLLLLAVHERSDAWLIYLVALVSGVGGTVFFPARSALLRVMLPDALLADANGALAASRQGLRIIAPLAGAVLYSAFGGGTVAILDSATFAASLVFLGALGVRETRPAPPTHGFRHEVSLGIRHIWRTPALRRIVLAVTLAALVTGFAETAIFSVIGTGLHRRPSFFGVLSAFQGIGAIAGGITAGPLLRRIGDARLIGLGLACFAVGDGLLVFSSFAIVLVGLVLAGIGVAYWVVGFATALQTRTPFVIQGRVSAAADLSLSLAQTISIATGAALSTLLDYRVLLLVLAGAAATAGAFVTRTEPGLGRA